jgi:hypothetical protein
MSIMLNIMSPVMSINVLFTSTIVLTKLPYLVALFKLMNHVDRIAITSLNKCFIIGMIACTDAAMSNSIQSNTLLSINVH